MTSPLDLKQTIQLLPEKLNFNGTKSLTQFQVRSYLFKIQENGATLSVEIVLQRIFSYHLTNTFIPTSSLLLLVEITLFFKESQTELSNGLSLTIMLVMYTMYQSINEPLTKTAYLKMIDYWLLFCLLVPFVIFLIETYWLLNTNLEVDSSNKSCKCVKQEKTQSRKIIQLIVPAITGLFVVAFVIVAVCIY